MRRWESVPPVPRVSYADPLNSVHLLTPGVAVEDQVPEFPFQIDLHPEEFQPHLLCRDRDGVICGQTSLHRFVDDLVGVRPARYGVDGMFEDAALSTNHAVMLGDSIDRQLCSAVQVPTGGR